MKENQDQFQSYIETTFNICVIQHIMSNNFEKYPEYNEEFILKGNFPDLDDQLQSKIESKDKLQCILKFLEKCFNKKEKDKNKYIKEHQPSTSELCLIVTKKRKDMLFENIKK